VIPIDTNLLIYAHREDSVWHDAADACLMEVAQSRVPWAIPWPCLHELLAIATHPRIYSPPTPRELAIAQIEAWMESPSLVLISGRTCIGLISSRWLMAGVLLADKSTTRGSLPSASSMG